MTANLETDHFFLKSKQTMPTLKHVPLKKQETIFKQNKEYYM